MWFSLCCPNAYIHLGSRGEVYVPKEVGYGVETILLYTVTVIAPAVFRWQCYFLVKYEKGCKRRSFTLAYLNLLCGEYV